jgi:hypothetical protein
VSVFITTPDGDRQWVVTLPADSAHAGLHP